MKTINNYNPDGSPITIPNTSLSEQLKNKNPEAYREVLEESKRTIASILPGKALEDFTDYSPNKEQIEESTMLQIKGILE